MSIFATMRDTDRPFIKRVSGPLVGVFIMFYLCFHAISGERGVLALFRESHRLEQLTADLARIKAEREKLSHKAKGLSNGSLDLDLLDEQAKRILGVAGKNEVVIFTGDRR